MFSTWHRVALSWLFFAAAMCVAIVVNSAVQAAHDPMAFSKAALAQNLGPIASVKPVPVPAIVKPVKRVKPKKIATK